MATSKSKTATMTTTKKIVSSSSIKKISSTIKTKPSKTTKITSQLATADPAVNRKIVVMTPATNSLFQVSPQQTVSAMGGLFNPIAPVANYNGAPLSAALILLASPSQATPIFTLSTGTRIETFSTTTHAAGSTSFTMNPKPVALQTGTSATSVANNVGSIGSSFSDDNNNSDSASNPDSLSTSVITGSAVGIAILLVPAVFIVWKRRSSIRGRGITSSSAIVSHQTWPAMQSKQLSDPLISNYLPHFESKLNEATCATKCLRMKPSPKEAAIPDVSSSNSYIDKHSFDAFGENTHETISTMVLTDVETPTVMENINQRSCSPTDHPILACGDAVSFQNLEKREHVHTALVTMPQFTPVAPTRNLEVNNSFAHSNFFHFLTANNGGFFSAN